MARKVQGMLTLILPASEATTSGVLGPALSAFGVNPATFVKDFNAQTASYPVGTVLSTVITIYDDTSYTFVTMP